MNFKNLGKIILGTSLSALLMLTANAEFAKTNTYSGQFGDVKADAWYANEVKSAYELGFMNGMTDTEFGPQGSVTVAQGITMASRIHALNLGKEAPANSTTGNWYDNAVKYALDNKLFSDGDFDSYTRPIKRYEMAELVYATMPTDAFAAKNTVYSIPDVSNAADYKNKLLTLYNAGIVMGSDAYGSFNPESNITRAECAAIINRVALPENRLSKTLISKQTLDAYILCYNDKYDVNAENVGSGWVYDNRGGGPRMEISGHYGTLSDVSEKYGTALIREFNPIYTGVIVTETSVKVNGNGVSLEYRDVNDKVLYSLKTVDGAWAILGEDGKYTPVVPGAVTQGKETEFSFRITLDIDNGTSTTFIDNKNVGTHKLLSDSLLNFRFATDEKNKVEAVPGTINIVANYAAYDNFDLFGAEAVYGWNVSGTEVKDGELVLNANASAKKTFNKVSDKVSIQVYTLVNGKDTSFTAYDGTKAAVTLSIKDGKLTAGGKELYTCTQNMWYRLRIDLDTKAGNAKIWLNGRVIGDVKLDGVTGLDSIEAKTGADTTVKLDNVLVYNTYDHADYVPEPTTKASLDDYIVGMNICSLWKNGEHRGWSCISAYDEPTTVLGYYDEGNIESADWEIKYMVEHGIDFQAFCWYNDQKNAPTKMPTYASQLHEGYMYSKYSDYMKYTLIWEATNGVRFDSEYFRNHLVPYWFENYFLDDRYLKLDNQIILCIFGADNLANNTYFGSVEAAKAELAYLDEAAKKYGFEGVIILSGNGDFNKAADMGIEAAYAYGWGTEGKKFTHNKDSILKSAQNKRIYTVPTISTGFDSIPWHGVRYGNMPVEEYKQSHDWVKNEYLPAYAKKGTWQEKLVMLSNWNEYGEGTYVMPSGLNGFGYLDVLRSAYTNLSQDHTDITPTANQSERFNHLYPQYARLLRHDGWIDTDKKAQGSLYINDILTDSPVVGEKNDAGLLFPFDAGDGIGYFMNVHFTWRENVGSLKIEGNGHTVEYLVGSSKYTVDGTQKDLGYTLYLTNGLPMLSYKTLCEALGFTYEEKDGNAYVKTEQYDLYNEAISSQNNGSWEFNVGMTEGWTSGDMNVFCQDGALVISNKKDDNYDPKMTYNEKEFVTDAFTGIEMKVRYNYTNKNGQAEHVALYYITDRDSQWNEKKVFRVKLSSLSSGDEWETLKMDFTGNTYWRGNVTAFRIDPFNAVGTMEIDYIKLIPNPDYVYVDPSTLPFGLHNGDAEDVSYVAFFNPAGKVEIVEDPRNASNHVYKVTAKDGKNYGHFRQSVVFKENCKYEYSMDICYLGNNAGADTGKDGAMMVNFVYPDGEGKNDHAINFTTLPLNEWTTITGSYTPSSISSDKGHIFAPFVNPEGEYGPVYLIDNIVVKEFVPMKGLENAGILDGKVPYSNNAKDVSYSAEENAYVFTAPDRKAWTYFLADTKFVNNAEYTITFDAKLLGDAGTSTAICPNMMYKSTDGKTDHVVGSKVISTSDGWVTMQYTYVLDNMSSDKNQHKFSIYANPVGELAVSYMIRNVSVTSNTEYVPEETPEEEPEKAEQDFGTLTAKALENAGILDGVTPTSISTSKFGYSEENEAYVLAGLSDKKAWTYFNVNTTFEEGAEYTISYDLKLIGDAAGNTDVTTNIKPNIRYSDKDGGYDHVAGNTTITVSDGWVHCEFTYKVENLASEQKQNQFSIFADPRNEIGISYMVKNVSVTAK